MVSSTTYDFRASHFPHKDIPRVIGQPNYANLTSTYKKIKANAQSVPCSAPGTGQVGHLGAVTSALQYAFVSNVPFVPPAHPGPLVFPNNTTQIQARIIEHDRNEQRIAHHETYNAVVRQLKQQIEEVFDSEWLEALRNPISNTITASVPAIFEHLFRLYGNVNSESLAALEDEVKQMTYDPASNGVDTVFNSIKKLQDYADAASTPFTQHQIINIAMNIFKRTHHFGQAITEWNRAVAANANHNTWLNFKNDFRTAHKELMERSDLVAADTNFGANFVQEITNAVSERINDSVTEQLNLLSLQRQQPAPEEQFVPAFQAPLPPSLLTPNMMANHRVRIYPKR